MTALEERGLTGPDLAIKLDVYFVAVEFYEEKPTPTRFAGALEAADIPLGSLAAILPVVEAIKEAKEAFEFLFKWGRGPLQRAWKRIRS